MLSPPYAKKVLFRNSPSLMNKKGITLIELLVVIIVVGILAAIAIPSYTSYMVRARRADGKTALEQLRASQEMWRAEKGSYSTDATLVELQTTMGAPANTAGDYTITLNSTTATTFLAIATPNTSRQTPDGPLSIDQNGVKSPAAKWSK